MTITTGDPAITGSDIDDLVIRVRQAAGDTAELEAAKASLFGTAGAAPPDAQLIRQRLLTVALHHGGDLLAKLLTRLGPRETAVVRRYAHRLGHFLETLEIWSAKPIMLTLMRFGVPYIEAESIAVAILLIVW
ncbi:MULTISPECIES: hypothetical protein [Streptomyces]|uniref:Uncharacterized protein n=1 Tax=Streptomyces lonegramiae TaxID=3075524 RepID=A0ABU2XP78_9ACTN|nr:hypothetical protein [Streptomyces sp. DSM 41529]MDT0547290.1 hypothetical protein [Streptomyces sp. DSM 41529]